MNFDPPQEFHVEEPERFNVELTAFVDAAARALTQVEKERSARPTPRRIRKSGPCALDELLVVDTARTDVNVVLPRLDQTTRGRSVSYVRMDTANALTFSAAGGLNINGSASFTAASAVGRQPDIIADTEEWWA